jgi:hypothetical protein
MTIDFRTARRSFIIYVQGQIMGQKVGNKNEEAILKRQSRRNIFFRILLGHLIFVSFAIVLQH